MTIAPHNARSAVPRRLSGAATAAYAAGSFGTGVYSTVPSVLLLYFCTETLGIPAATASLIVLIPKVWSVGWDPFVGFLSDRLTLPWGRRRPFMLVGLLGMVASFIFLFSPPVRVAGSALWVGACYFALVSCYSLYAVPYVAIPAEIGDGDAVRSRLIERRMIMVMVGILAGASGAPFFVDRFGGALAGYHAMAVILATLCLIFMVAPILMMAGRDRPCPADEPQRGIFDGWKRALADATLRRLLLTFLCQMTAVGAFFSALPYIIVGTLRRLPGDVSLALAIVLGAAILAVACWTWLAKRLGYDHASILAPMVFGIGTLVLGSVAQSDWGWTGFLAFAGFVGIGLAGLQVLPFVGAASAIGRLAPDQEASLTGIWVATEKVALGIGAALTGLIVSTLPPASAGFAVTAGALPTLLCLAAVLLSPRRPSGSEATA